MDDSLNAYVLLFGVAAAVLIVAFRWVVRSTSNSHNKRPECVESINSMKEYHHLVKQKQWDAAYDNYLETFYGHKESTRAVTFATWTVCVGDAFMDVLNGTKVQSVFELALRLMEESSTKSPQRKKMRTTLKSLLDAHTLALCGYSNTTDFKANLCFDYQQVAIGKLVKLVPLWIDLVRLYTNKVCPKTIVRQMAHLVDTIIHHHDTALESSKKLIYAILQLNIKITFPSKSIDQWKLMLCDKKGQNGEAYPLRKSLAASRRNEWEKALLHYKVYFQMCSSMNQCDLGLFVQIRLRMALNNITNRTAVNAAFDTSRAVLSKMDVMTEKEKNKCILLLFDVLEARIQTLSSSSVVVNLEFFHNLNVRDTKPWSFLAHLEVISLYEKFLRVCASSNRDPLDKSPMPHLFTQLIQREQQQKNDQRAKGLVQFARKQNPSMNQYYPKYVMQWKERGLV